ncbi:MAG TPA: hypothetical protein VIK14_13315 [Ignavibacteria bacterium]
MNKIKSNNKILENMKIKKELIGFCQNRLNEMIQTIQTAIDDAQKSANEHIGAMESRYDTFKEESQDLKNAYTSQLELLYKINSNLKDISIKKSFSTVDYGAIVALADINYFIFSNILDDPIIINGNEYLPISLTSPLGIILNGKKKNEEFEFNGKYFKIFDVY